MTIDANLLNLLVATVLPFLVALTTKQATNSSVKAVLLALLSGLLAMGTVALDGGGVIDQSTLSLGVQNFVVSVAAYYGLWKPTAASEKVAEKTEKVGFLVKSS